MAKIEQEEAVLMLGRLCESRSKVLCSGSCWGWEFYLIGKLTEASPEKVIFRSDDGKHVLGLKLDMENTHFFYTEPREMRAELLEDVPEVDRTRSAISIALPLRIIPGTEDTYDLQNLPRREKIFFMELPE